MASIVKKEGTQYASTSREESSEEQRELTALYNVSTYALEAMDMLQLEMGRVEEENKILKEFFSKIMKCGGDKYHQIIQKRGW